MQILISPSECAPSKPMSVVRKTLLLTPEKVTTLKLPWWWPLEMYVSTKSELNAVFLLSSQATLITLSSSVLSMKTLKFTSMKVSAPWETELKWEKQKLQAVTEDSKKSFLKYPLLEEREVAIRQIYCQIEETELRKYLLKETNPWLFKVTKIWKVLFKIPNQVHKEIQMV